MYGDHQELLAAAQPALLTEHFPHWTSSSPSSSSSCVLCQWPNVFARIRGNQISAESGSLVHTTVRNYHCPSICWARKWWRTWYTLFVCSLVQSTVVFECSSVQLFDCAIVRLCTSRGFEREEVAQSWGQPVAVGRPNPLMLSRGYPVPTLPQRYTKVMKH